MISQKQAQKYGKSNVAIFNSFNFICSTVLCIQLSIEYSTCIQHSMLYSIFNFPFNIQLFILYSIQSTHSIVYSTISIIYSTLNNSFDIQLFVSTFNYSFNLSLEKKGPGNEFIFHEPSLFLVSYSIRLTISFPRFIVDRFIRLQWRKI